MNSLKNIRFSAWKDGNREMVSFCADCVKNEDEPGLRYISFYMTRKEFVGVVEGNYSSVNDIGHNLRAFGESWTFYDLDFPTHANGVMQVPFHTVTMPSMVQAFLLRWARMIWKLQTDNPELQSKSRPVLNISEGMVSRWTKMYGQGTGSLKLNLPAFPETISTDPKFVEKVEHIKKIAQNTTYWYKDEAAVNIYEDRAGEDYYWDVRDPGGRRIMNGGLINHEGSWSIHT